MTSARLRAIVRAPLALTFGLLVVIAPFALAAPTGHGIEVDTAPTSNWAVVEIDVLPSDWTREGDEWVLRYGASVQGLAGLSMADVTYVRDGDSFGFFPWIESFDQLSMQAELHAPVPPGEHEKIVLLAASTEAAAWSMTLYAGATPSSFATGVAAGSGPDGVVLSERTDGPPIGVRDTLARSLERSVAGPSWYYARVLAGAGAGAWAYDARVEGDGIQEDVSRSFVSGVERSAGLGLMGTLHSSATLSIELDRRADVAGHVGAEEVVVPFDLASIGVNDRLGWFGSESWGMLPGTPPLPGWTWSTLRSGM